MMKEEHEANRVEDIPSAPQPNPRTPRVKAYAMLKTRRGIRRRKEVHDVDIVDGL